MSHDEIVALLQAQLPAEAFPALEPDPGRACVRVAPAALPAVARLLRDDPRLGFNFLRCISGLDLHPEPWFELVYDLLALRPGAPGALWQHAGTLALRVRVARDGGTAPSLAAIWPAAEWHEREAYDMYGLPFDQHPDLRRILCPDDWVGWPLRRDYEFPREYEGIPSAAMVEQ